MLKRQTYKVGMKKSIVAGIHPSILLLRILLR